MEEVPWVRPLVQVSQVLKKKKIYIYIYIYTVEFLLGPVNSLGGLVVIAPARRAGVPGSNPGPGENFSPNLLIYIFVCVCLYIFLVFSLLSSL